MPASGSQCWYCDLPIRYDTYTGCSHGCKYCFARAKGDISQIGNGEGIEALRSFIRGQRTQETRFIDWPIPLHIGGMSDPFQPVERERKLTYRALLVLRDTGYPFVISTKGELVADPEYLDVLKDCNCVVQISMVCEKYDRLEKGAPPFSRRLEMLRAVSPKVKRTVVRVQPYMREVLPDVLENMGRFQECGAYGVILEGMKFRKRQPGLVKIGGDYCYPAKLLENDFIQLRHRAHECGLQFLAGENRLRAMGDSLTCCGCEGLEGFRPNRYNLAHILAGETPEAREAMKRTGSAYAFRAIYQTYLGGQRLKSNSFVEELTRMLHEKQDYVLDVLTKRK